MTDREGVRPAIIAALDYAISRDGDWPERVRYGLREARDLAVSLGAPEAPGTDLPDGYRIDSDEHEWDAYDPEGKRIDSGESSQRVREIAWAHFGRAEHQRERERAALLRECAAVINEAMIYTVRRNDGSAWMAGARALLAHVRAHLGSGR